jgi:hypothetical protein
MDTSKKEFITFKATVAGVGDGTNGRPVVSLHIQTDHHSVQEIDLVLGSKEKAMELAKHLYKPLELKVFVDV